jgi:ATP-binding cassette subfamily F protein 3
MPKRSLAAGYLRLAPAPHSGAEIVRLTSVDFSYDGTHMILKNVDIAIARGEKIAIVGFNGMGKTTLLRIMAGTRKPTSGTCTLGHKVQPGYLSQEFSETIPSDVSVFECAKRCKPGATEKELRSQLGAFGFSADDIGKPAGVISGGEKIRLAFLRLFLDPPNFMLLDEPTTHLDLEGRTTLEACIRKYDGTVCLVSHDIEFVRNTVTSIIEVSPAGVRRFPGGYDYYREKSAELDAGKPEIKQAIAPRFDNDNAPLSNKDQRRARAQERTKWLPKIKVLRVKVTQAEAKIAELEAELEKLSAILFNPTPETKFGETNRKLKYVQDQLAHQTEAWERDATELNALLQEQKAAEENA